MRILEWKKHDIHNKLYFRLRGRVINNGNSYNNNNNGGGGGGDNNIHVGSGQRVDPNYIRISGTEKEIYKMIAAHTNPRLGANDVAGVLARLDGKFFYPRAGPTGRNGYALVPKSEWDTMFRLEQVSCHVVSEATLVRDLNALITDYARRVFRRTMLRYHYGEFIQYRDNEDWTRFRTSADCVLPLTDSDILYLYYTEYRTDSALTDVIASYVQHRNTLVDNIQITQETWLELSRYTNASVDTLQSTRQLTKAHLIAFQLANADHYVCSMADAGIAICRRPMCNGWLGTMSEADIPDMNYDENANENDMSKLKIIEFRRNSRGVLNLYVALEAAYMFDPSMIYQAWQEVCMSKSFRPGKYLLGMVDPKYPTRYAVRIVSEQTKTEILKIMKEEGDDRNEGITIHRMGDITPSLKHMLFSRSLTSLMDQKEWEQIYDVEQSIRQAGEQTILDMEVEAYYRQHMKAGRSLEEEVISPQWYYDKYALAHPEEVDPDNGRPQWSYPESIIKQDASGMSAMTDLQEQHKTANQKRKLHARLQRATRMGQQHTAIYNTNSMPERGVFGQRVVMEKRSGPESRAAYFESLAE